MQLDLQTYRKDLRYPDPGPDGWYHGYGRAPEGPQSPARGRPVSPSRAAHDIRSLLIHTTNGNGVAWAPEAAYLRDSADVSSGYVVSSTDDTVVQLLPDTIIAWHAGAVADGDFSNAHSIGIEIAWTPKAGPLAPQAIANLTTLVARLLGQYPTIRKIDTHRAQAVPKGRKVDPSGWDDAAFYAWRDAMLRPVPPPATIPGPNGASFRADKDFADFWALRGGLWTFGYALSDQATYRDPSGQQAAVVRCERAILKREVDGSGIRPMLLSEAARLLQ